ncbi:hypothetical protein [Alistipes sp. ZOR0009]|uniref:hypothetical protein n=1 Tax=Alistipes sp. ZOR0009 TaxID=1339253 RepID=UPI000647B356|nr:hypothetical protein [Alistipes sp. ZOR0009]
MAAIIDKIFVWGFILLVGVFALAIISLPTVIAYLIYRWISKKKTYLKVIGISLLIIAPIWTTYEIYTAIYPTDSFYFNEFKDVTLREIPSSAKIIRKTATYPYFHGDYASVSLIKLSPKDYNSLFTALNNDKRIIKNGEFIGCREFDEVMGNLKTNSIEYSFTRKIPKEENHYFYIGFLNDNSTIIVLKYVS